MASAEGSAAPSTLSALDEAGDWLYFEDFVGDGDEVELYREPETETGFMGVVIVYLNAEGKWRARPITPEENKARNARIMQAHDDRAKRWGVSS